MRIAIVGGGIAGLVVAYELACAGRGVTVFEQGTLGSGASGKALGVLVPINLDRPIDKLQRAGIEKWPELARRLAGDAGVDVGTFWRDWGGGRQQVNMAVIFEVLRRAIEALGGEILEHRTIMPGDPRLAKFERVLLAAGWGNVALGGQAMTVSAGLAARVKGHVARLVVGDNLFISPYFDGKSVLLGSVNWDLDGPGDGSVPADKLAELLARAAVLVPELAEAEVIESWVGYRPKQAPRLPLVRHLGGEVWAIAGLGKTGFGLAPMVADAVLHADF